MNWSILDIEETKDKRAITRAYREKLLTVNPEEKPEEFKLLRAAYEEALSLADQEEQPENEKSPMELWIGKVAAVYAVLGTRIDPEKWRELLRDDVCIGLDTKADAEKALLGFVMEHFRIPHRVWVVLNDTFAFDEREEELRAEYPGDFIQYAVMEPIRNEDSFRYDLFAVDADGEQVDDFFRTYYEISRTPFDDAAELFARLEANPVKHPYGEAYRCRYDSYKGVEGAVERLEALHETYPDDLHISTDLMGIYNVKERYADNKALAEKVLEQEPEHFVALKALAYAYAGMQEYANAVDKLNKLMNLVGGNQRQLDELNDQRREWNLKLIDRYRAKLAADPSDAKNCYDLLWCLLQNEMAEEAFEVLPKLQENYPTPGKYLRMIFLAQSLNHKDEAALVTANRMLEMGPEGMQDAEDEDPQAGMARYTDTLVRKSVLLLKKGKTEEAVKVMEAAVKLTPDDAELQTRRTQAYLYMKRYPEALEGAREIIRLMPEFAHGYSLAATAYFEMKRDNDAFTYVNTALEQDPTDLYMYLLKLRIFARNEADEAAEGLITFLNDNGITEHITIDYCRCQMAARKEGDPEKILEMYSALEPAIAAMEDKPDWTAEYYWKLALSLADVKDSKGDYSREDLLAVLERGLAIEPQDFDLLEYKAWLLMKERRNEEALAIYHDLEKRPRANTYIEKQLAELYYRDAGHHADTAMKYCEMIAETEEESRLYHLNVAYLCYVMKRFDESEKHLDRAAELSPEEAWIYYRYSQLYLVQNRLEDALRCALKSVEIETREITDRKRRDERYWIGLAQTYRRMNRPLDAVRTYADAADQCADYRSYGRDAFETLMTAGMLKEARDHLANWRKDLSDVAEWSSVEAMLYLLTDQIGKCEFTLSRYKEKMPTREYNKIRAIAATTHGRFETYVDYRLAELNRVIDNSDTSLHYEFASYAISLWFVGRFNEARQAAARGLEEFEQRYRKEYTMYVPIALGCRSLCLALTGRIDEARQAISRMNQCALCGSCAYPICKDQYLYAAEIELVAGDLQQASVYLKKCREADPGEESAVVVDAYMKLGGAPRNPGNAATKKKGLFHFGK